jgi:mitochondrial chaperone BCS1
MIFSEKSPSHILLSFLSLLVAFVLGNYANFLPISFHSSEWSSSLFMLLKELLQKNQFCQAILFSSISASLLYCLQLFYRSYLMPLFSEMMSSVTIHNIDPNFNVVIDYISEHLLSQTEGGAQSTLQASTHQPKKTRKDWIQEYLGSDQRTVNTFEFRPDSDHAIHRFNFDGHVIYMTRKKSSEPIPLTGRDVPFTPESLTLSVWGPNTMVIQKLFQISLESDAKGRHGNSLRIFTQSNSSWLIGWELALVKNRRMKDSVILDDNDMDFLLKDAKKFLNRSQWYANMGIPYRRGYLLYGPPGCGKTSFAQVLATELGLDLSMLNLTHSDMNDNKLAEYLRDAPLSSVIVLEDIDAIFVERNLASKKLSNEGSSNVSFSGLLNAIDGVASQEGRIFFMTTNYIDRLDPALIRPGRCDVKFEVKKASRQQIERMFLRFYPNEQQMAIDFASQLPVHELSMASLQGHFLNGDQTPEEAIRRIPELLLQTSKPQSQASRSISDHLKRVGLERYSHLFLLNGYSTVDDLITDDEKNTIQVSDLIQLSAELSYDPQGQKLLSLLLLSTNSKSKSVDTFLKTHYAIADMSALRDAFFVAYAHDDQKESSSENISSQEIGKLSHQFTELLSREGKGLISHYQLKCLLEMYPNRPRECVGGALAFIQPLDQFQAHGMLPNQSMTLYQFLKRAGLRHHIHTFNKQRINTLDELISIEKDKDILKFGKKLKSDFHLTSDESIDLAEILSKTSSTRQTYSRFGLYSRQYIIHTFISFYSNSLNFGKESHSDQHNGDLRQSHDLPAIAFEFSALVTNAHGAALVSIIEILIHLKSHSNPQSAVDSTQDELISPPFPTPPCPSPTPSPPTEWVHDWLSAYDKENSTNLSQYSSKFIKEGLSTEEDFIHYPLLTEEILEKVGVNKLGHRRLIIRMQDHLIHKRGAIHA